MNKIMHATFAATAAILLLAGCSAVSAEAQDAPSVAPSSSSEPSAVPSGPVTVAPSQAPVMPTSGMIPNGEAEFLKSVRNDPVPYGVSNSTDADLLRAGHYACELFAQGQTYDQMDVIQGDEAALAAAGQKPNRNDAMVAGIASGTLCVQYDIAK